MADKKPITKKAVVVPTLDELHTQLAEKQNDLVETKRSHAAGELANPRALTHTRKEIARLMTTIAAIRTANSVADKESK